MAYFLVIQQKRPFACRCCSFYEILPRRCQLDKVNKPWNANFMVHLGGVETGRGREGYVFVIVRQNVVVVSFGS